jgi:hypothetical protein
MSGETEVILRAEIHSGDTTRVLALQHGLARWTSLQRSRVGPGIELHPQIEPVAQRARAIQKMSSAGIGKESEVLREGGRMLKGHVDRSQAMNTPAVCADTAVDGELL